LLFHCSLKAFIFNVLFKKILIFTDAKVTVFLLIANKNFHITKIVGNRLWKKAHTNGILSNRSYKLFASHIAVFGNKPFLNTRKSYLFDFVDVAAFQTIYAEVEKFNTLLVERG
jgi:hypothetical protein